MSFSPYAGAFGAEELMVMRRIFDRVSAEQGIAPKSPEGEALAAEIVQLRVVGFQEQALLDKLRKRHQ